MNVAAECFKVNAQCTLVKISTNYVHNILTFNIPDIVRNIEDKSHRTLLIQTNFTLSSM